MKHRVVFTPNIVVPEGLQRQPASVHGGMTIEQMTSTVVAFLNKIKCKYELPDAYSNKLAMPTSAPKYVPECRIKPNDGFPMIVYSECYRNGNRIDPAYIACDTYAPLGTSVLSPCDITTYLDGIYLDVMLFTQLCEMMPLL